LLEQRAIMAQDESGKILFAEEKGRIKQAIALIMLLLKERFIEFPEDEIASQLESLSLEDLENLVKAVLKFNNIDDLSNWLADR